MSLAQKISFILVCTFASVALYASPKASPKEALKAFYQHINNNECEAASLVRPNYSPSRCETISEVVTHEIGTVFNNGLDAVLLLSIDIYSDNAKSYFSGYVRLQNESDEWMIIGPYKSQEHYSLDEYIRDYLPEEKNAPTETSEEISYIEDDSTAVADDTATNEIEQVQNPAVSKYLLGEQDIAGNYTSLLKHLRMTLESIAEDQILLIDRSRSSIYVYNSSNLLLGFFPILSTFSEQQIPNGLYRLAKDEVTGNSENGPIHLNHLQSIDENIDNDETSYFIRNLLDSDVENSLLLSPIDLGKLRGLLSGNSLIYIGN